MLPFSQVVFLFIYSLRGIVFLGHDTTSICSAGHANYDSEAGGDRRADKGNISADNARDGSAKEDGGADGNGDADIGTNRHISTTWYGCSNGDGGAAVAGKVEGIYPAATGQPRGAADPQPLCDVYVQLEASERRWHM